MVNYFRRIIDLNSLPVQFDDGRGRLLTKPLSMLLGILTVGIIRNSNHYADNISGELLELLLKGLAEPSLLTSTSLKFATQQAWTTGDVPDRSEVEDIVRHITHSIKMEDRKRLSEIAKNISAVSKMLKKRPFVQAMSGSSGKSSRSFRPRGFNIYDVVPRDKDWRIHARRFDWDWEAKKFTVAHESRTVNFPRTL